MTKRIHSLVTKLVLVFLASTGQVVAQQYPDYFLAADGTYFSSDGVVGIPPNIGSLLKRVRDSLKKGFNSLGRMQKEAERRRITEELSDVKAKLMMAQMVQLQIAHQIQNLKEKVEAAWKQHRYNQGIIRLARLAVGGTTPQMRANLEKQNKEIRDSVDEMNKEIAALEQQLRDIKKKNAGEVDRLTQMIKDLELKLQEAGGDVGDLQGALGPILPDPIEEAIVAAEEDFVDAGMQELLDVYSEPGIEDYVIADHAVNWTPEPGESTPPALWNPSVTESFVDVAIDLSVIPPYTQETAPYSPSNTPAYAPPAYPQMNPPAVPSAAPPSYPQMNVPAVPAAAPINYPQMPTPANPVPYSAYPEYPGFPMMPTP